MGYTFANEPTGVCLRFEVYGLWFTVYSIDFTDRVQIVESRIQGLGSRLRFRF